MSCLTQFSIALHWGFSGGNAKQQMIIHFQTLQACFSFWEMAYSWQTNELQMEGLLLSGKVSQY